MMRSTQRRWKRSEQVSRDMRPLFRDTPPYAESELKGEPCCLVCLSLAAVAGIIAGMCAALVILA